MQHSTEDLYDVVDDHDEVIRQTSKAELHTKGLLHRGVHVLFYTPEKTVILQRRSPTKTTFPNTLDVTVGGHVDAGESYEVAALREVHEETGLQLELSDLRFITKLRQVNTDPLSDTQSNYFCTMFAYAYNRTKPLSLESGKATEFVERPLPDLAVLTQVNSGDYSPSLYKEQYKVVWNALLNI